jgi:hypothetical protein
MTNAHGVGALGAAIIIGHTGDVITRFPDAGHDALHRSRARRTPRRDGPRIVGW